MYPPGRRPFFLRTRTILTVFEEFAKLLTPSDTETNAAKTHRDSLHTCLTRNFGITAFFRSGSFGNGTSVRSYSDVDYFAEVPVGIARGGSGALLGTFRDAIAGRFPETGVRIDSPAIRVPFGTDASERTEVIPAILHTYQHQSRIYQIADGNGGWMLSSPDLHNDYVRAADRVFEGKLKTLIRFLKAWKYCRSLPISSFYLELFATAVLKNERAILYDYDLLKIFRELEQFQLRTLADPAGVSAGIAPCRTQAQLNEVFAQVQRARDLAARAVAVRDSKLSEAISLWNQVFNTWFPK